MLLSIDRVLQLLGEGKSIDKIAEMAKCDAGDVVSLVDNARSLLSKYEKNASKRKIIIKKKNNLTEDNVEMTDIEKQRDIFSGAELSVIPVQSSLTMYVAALIADNKTGIGIVINDRDGKQVGKVSASLPAMDEISSGLSSIIRALRIADYFSTSELKIRTHMEDCIKQIKGTSKMREKRYDDQLNKIKDFVSVLGKVTFESISTSQNDKALFFAGRSIEK